MPGWVASRSLTTPSPLRFDAVVNDLDYWVGGRAERKGVLWAGCWCVVLRKIENKQNKKQRLLDVIVECAVAVAVKAGKALPRIGNARSGA
jgi:hypothetical protein